MQKVETVEEQRTSMNSFTTRFQSKIEMAKSMREEEKLYRYNGVLYPVIISPEENLRALETVEARSDDILLVAYPKCGFNWMVTILRKIITASTGEKVESKIPPLLEFFGPEMLQVSKKKLALNLNRSLGICLHLNSITNVYVVTNAHFLHIPHITSVLQLLHEAPSPRLLGTHMHPDNIPPSFYQKKTKMLVIFRNPKDTSVSFYHFSKKNPILPTVEPWDQFFIDFIGGEVPWGSYFDHALAWEKQMNDINVMIITFEELKQDLKGSIQMVAEFFGFKLTDAQIQTIAEESTFDAMKKGSKDSHGQMGNVFFRKGEIGDWRNHFSQAQSEQMNATFEKHLGGTNLGARLNYDVYCK
ncbi:sulfotransferase 6B1 [Silurus meridionalis]|nr:sulfotransferase 6B1 [Silurus meridionalis]